MRKKFNLLVTAALLVSLSALSVTVASLGLAAASSEEFTHGMEVLTDANMDEKMS